MRFYSFYFFLRSHLTIFLVLVPCRPILSIETGHFLRSTGASPRQSSSPRGWQNPFTPPSVPPILAIGATGTGNMTRSAGSGGRKKRDLAIQITRSDVSSPITPSSTFSAHFLVPSSRQNSSTDLSAVREVMSGEMPEQCVLLFLKKMEI